MDNESSQEGQKEQEEACAKTFIDWLYVRRNNKYKIKRSEEIQEIKGRWDFVAESTHQKNWIAIEVKELVVPQPRRQFGSWSKFCDSLTNELRLKRIIKGSYAVITGIPWNFSQKQSKKLKEAFIVVLSELNSEDDLNNINLGEKIASVFPDWPKKPPESDHELWIKEGIYNIIKPPEDIFMFKLNGNGTSVEVGGSVGQAYDVNDALNKAIMEIFQYKEGEGVKPNIQLREAKEKGASETVLLLDSYIKWAPNVVAEIISHIDQEYLSYIDSIFLVSCSRKRVKKVWPL